jgi:hypothetical protein
LVLFGLKIIKNILITFASLVENLSPFFHFKAKINSMNKPVTFYPDSDIKEKLESKLEVIDMSKDEYLSYLIDQDSEEYEEPEDEEEEEDETLSGVKTLGSIQDITDKNDLIASQQERIEDLEARLSNYEDDKALNQLFDVLEGHTLKIREDGKDYKIKSKADFIKCLIHSYYITFEPNDFGLEDEDFFGEDED